MGLFNSKKTTVTQDPLIPDFQLGVGKQLSDYISKYLAQYQPGQAYQGQLSADATPQEQTSLDMLTKYLGQPGTGSLFDQASGQISDTLAGKYASTQDNPYIDSLTNLSNQNTQDQINASRRSAGARGSYYTQGAINQEGQIRERSINNLNAIVGDFLNTERGRQFSAAPIAQQLDQYKNQTVPLGQIGAAQSFGSLNRILQQSDLERQYTDFKRQRDEQSGLAGQAENLYGTNVPYGIKSLTTTSPSTFMKMWGEVNPFAGSYNTAKYGYDTNQSSVGGSLQALLSVLSGGGGIMSKLKTLTTGVQ